MNLALLKNLSVAGVILLLAIVIVSGISSPKSAIGRQEELIKTWGQDYDQAQAIGIKVSDKLRAAKAQLEEMSNLSLRSVCGMQKAAWMKKNIVEFYEANGNPASKDQIEKWLSSFQCESTLAGEKDKIIQRIGQEEQKEEGGSIIPKASASVSDSSAEGKQTIPLGVEWPLDTRRIMDTPTKITSAGHHTLAVDLRAKEGTPLKSICDGKVDRLHEDPLKGRVLVIQCDGGERLLYGHLAGYNVAIGDTVGQGQFVAKSGGATEKDIQQRSTAPHLHFEVWLDGKMLKLDDILKVYTGDNTEEPDSKTDGKKMSIKVYMTHYNLGVTAQNDNSPCIGASGKDLCLIRKSGGTTIALTSDQRKKMNIKFGDLVNVTGNDFSFKASVEDEMNIRFRRGCIKKQSFCIKADYACFRGEKCHSGVVTVEKA